MIKTACFVSGVWWVQHMAQLPALGLMLLMTAFIIVTLLNLNKLQKSFSFFNPIICMALLFAGVSWASAMAHWRLSDALPVAWQQQEVEVIGVVASLPEASTSRTRFLFDVEKVLTPRAVVPSHISLNLYPSSWRQVSQAPLMNLKSGERWQFTVKLKRPHSSLNPHGFDYAGWALAQNIRATGYVRTKHAMMKLQGFVWRPKYGIDRLRGVIQQHIHALLQGPLAGVITALVIGEDAGIQTDTWDLMLRTGITHLMAISGLHITMLSGLAFAVVYTGWKCSSRLLMLLPARKAAILSGAIVALMYALLAGFSVPTQRTFYMLMVFAVALWSGRQVNIAQVLSMALLVVVLLDPWAVSAAGFWLSFGAVVVISFALNARVAQPHWLYAAIKTQWAVTLGLLPVLILLFHQASIISPLANAVAIPVVSLLVTPLALLGGFLQIDWPILVAHWGLAQLMVALNGLDSLPVSLWAQSAPPLWSVALAIISVVCSLLPQGVPLRYFSLMGLLPMLLVEPERPQVGELKVTVLAVGQGLGVHLQTATHDLMYDTGPQYNVHTNAGKRVILPYLRGEGVQQLDMLILSHDDNDHTGGAVSIVGAMRVSEVLSSFALTHDLNDANQQRCEAGQQWVWDGVLFEVLYPNADMLADANFKDNDKSCVLKVSSDAGSILLTGDIERHGEQALLEDKRLQSEVLLVPHHGSRTSSTKRFLEAVSPSHSVIANGYLNHFHHPNDKVMSRYRAIDSSVYRTDLDGAVRLYFKTTGDIEHQLEVIRWQTRVPRYWRDSVESSL